MSINDECGKLPPKDIPAEVIAGSEGKHLNRHKKYFSIDTETGGLSSSNHDVLSIGYVVTDKDLCTIEKGEILIKGRLRRVTKDALAINKIDIKEHNKIACTRKKAIKKLQEVISRHWENNRPTLIGQNVPFDVRFLRALFESEGQEFSPDYTSIDLKVLWQTLIALGRVNTPDAKLDTILDYLKMGTTGQRHSALVDAENVIEVLKAIRVYISVF